MYAVKGKVHNTKTLLFHNGFIALHFFDVDTLYIQEKFNFFLIFSTITTDKRQFAQTSQFDVETGFLGKVRIAKADFVDKVDYCYTALNFCLINIQYGMLSRVVF